MIDPRIIREDLTGLKSMLEKRNMIGVVDLDEFSRVDEERRSLMASSDELREKRNRLSKEIGKLKSKGENADDVMKEVQGLSDEIKTYSDKIAVLDEKYKDMHLSLPNILDDSVP